MRVLGMLALAALPACAQLWTLSKEQMLELTANNPYERFGDGRPKIPDAVIEKCKGLSVEEIWAILPEAGFKYQYEGGFKILHPGAKLIGRAVTAQFMPARPDVQGPLEAKAPRNRGQEVPAHQRIIDLLQPGDVFVVDLFGKIEGGTVVGDNLAAAVYSATGKGIVVDGGIRDVEGIYPTDIQIYYRDAHPSAIRDVMLTGYNVPVRIGNATVMPGDLVFADRTGVYFVPPQFLDRILEKAEETHIHDEWTKEKFRTGKYRSSDLYGSPRDPAMKEEYRKYLEQRLPRTKKQ